MLRESNALIESHDEQLRRLRIAIDKIESERQCACNDRDRAQKVLDALHSAVREGQQLRAARAQSPNPHLHVVPDTEGTSVAPTVPEGGASEATAPPESTPVMVIDGPRSVTIMKVISTDGQRHWSVQAVTEALGEPREAVRRNRSVLETLCDRGALSRRESPDSDRRGKKKVSYQLAALWKAA